MYVLAACSIKLCGVSLCPRLDLRCLVDRVAHQEAALIETLCVSDGRAETPT